MAEKLMASGYAGLTVGETRMPQRIGYSITGSAGTPLPSDVRPAPVFETGTGRLEPIPGPAEVVRTAGTLIREAAVLPTTEEGNELVDELLSKHTQGLVVRPLERRLKK